MGNIIHVMEKFLIWNITRQKHNSLSLLCIITLLSFSSHWEARVLHHETMAPFLSK